MTYQQDLLLAADPQEWRALSLKQPWCDAILNGGKRIENRDWRNGSTFRGPLMLHASAGMSRVYYEEVRRWPIGRGLAWRAPAFERVQLGGIVAICNVVGVIESFRDTAAIDRATAAGQLPWYMEGFALVLDTVCPTAFVPCKGALGFWRVPADIAQRAFDTTEMPR